MTTLHRTVRGFVFNPLCNNHTQSFCSKRYRPFKEDAFNQFRLTEIEVTLMDKHKGQTNCLHFREKHPVQSNATVLRNMPLADSD
jgi:hypothetical protein